MINVIINGFCTSNIGSTFSSLITNKKYCDQIWTDGSNTKYMHDALCKMLKCSLKPIRYTTENQPSALQHKHNNKLKINTVRKNEFVINA